MTFMTTIKKKRYKFQTDLCVDELAEVSYSKAILFAKVRQLNGGSYTNFSKRMEVDNHKVRYVERFHFPCKMTANASSGVLDTCKCRISIRMEEKSGRHFRKLGFVDVNLAEYAGAGPTSQRYILQPYDSNHRLDNSILQLTLNITLREGDTIFQRPLTRQQPITLPGEESSSKRGGEAPTKDGELNPSSSSSTVIGGGGVTSSGGASSTTPSSLLMTTGISEAPSTSIPSLTRKDILAVPSSTSMVKELIKPEDSVDPASHTRNSSTTSQVSQASGYCSQHSQPAYGPYERPLVSLAVSSGGGGHSRQSSSGGESGHGRNLSQDSSDTGFFGSMEKEKRRKRLGEGRVDAELIVNEIMEGIDLGKAVQDEDAETSGLQLFVGKDGTVTFDKNSSKANNYEQVVIDGPR